MLLFSDIFRYREAVLALGSYKFHHLNAIAVGVMEEVLFDGQVRII